MSTEIKTTEGRYTTVKEFMDASGVSPEVQEDVESQTSEPTPLKVTHTGDGSAIVHLEPGLAYEVFPNGDMVVLKQEGDVTIFREFPRRSLADNRGTTMFKYHPMGMQPVSMWEEKKEGFKFQP